MNLAEIGIQYTFKYQNTDDKGFWKKIKRAYLINIQKNKFFTNEKQCKIICIYIMKTISKRYWDGKK